MKKRTILKILICLFVTTIIVEGLSLSTFGTVEVHAAAVTRNVNLNTGNSVAGIGDPTSTESGATKWEGSKVYMGNNLWRILDNDHSSITSSKNMVGETGYAFLLSEKMLLSEKKFNDIEENIRWENCTLRKELNGENNEGGSGTLLGDTFTTAENRAIAKLGNTDINLFTTGQTDKLFLLSIDDAENTSYGFGSNATRAYPGKTPFWWWLRSMGSYLINAALVFGDGTVDSHGSGVDRPFGSVRPAFNLDLSRVLFTSESGASKASDFVATTISSANTWNLTLAGGTGFAAERKLGETGSVTVGGTMHLNVSAIGTPDTDVTYTQLSAMLVDSDNTIVAYGKIKDTVEMDGNLAVTIPDTITAGNYTLKVFAEDVNSSTSSNFTDYASNIVDIPLIVEEARIYNTPTAVTSNGVTATVTYDKTSPQIKDADITATVTLSGTTTVTGIHTIGLSSNLVDIMAPNSTTKHLNAGDNPTDIFVFTFKLGTADITDIVLTNTFVADTQTITLEPMTLNFGTVQTGYARPDPLTFTITNTGNTDITAYSITTASDFEVTYTSGIISKNNGIQTFTVQPKAGLTAGNHTAAITIETIPVQSSAVEAQVNFTVTNPPIPTQNPTQNDNKESSNTNDTVVQPTFELYLQNNAEVIQNSIKGTTVTITSEEWNSYPLWFIELIQSRRDITVMMSYDYMGMNYTVCIPANRVVTIDDKIPWYGPLKIAEMFGAVTKQIVN